VPVTRSGGNPPYIAIPGQRMPVSQAMFTCRDGPGLTVTGVDRQRGSAAPVCTTRV
jgi:hypothetical protein